MPSTPIRVLLVDDHEMFREGLCLLLEQEADLEVVAQAPNGHEALTLAQRHRPDVVVMDLRMPGLDGVATTRALLRHQPALRVLVLTTFDDDALVFSAIAEGAAGYLLKGGRVSALASAIRSVAAGQAVLAPKVTGKVLGEFARMMQLVPRDGPTEDFGLTARELEVLRVLARGASNQEIASALFISEGTVKNHLTHIFRKLGVTDRVQALITARKHRLA